MLSIALKISSKEIFGKIYIKILKLRKHMFDNLNFQNHKLIINDFEKTHFDDNTKILYININDYKDKYICVSKNDALQIEKMINSINKEISSLNRYKPKINEEYWFINENCEVLNRVNKEEINKHYLNYNCFKTKEQAEKACSLFKDTLMKYHIFINN